MMQDLSEITFDEQDANLFLVEDARLRADALKHSVLPRLRVVMNVAIGLIREIDDIEVLEDSILSVFPNFREKRERELTHKYEHAFVGLGGQRKAKWPGFGRKDRKPLQIHPFVVHGKDAAGFGWAEDLSILAPFREQYQYRLQHQLFDHHFLGHNVPFPVSGNRLVELVQEFACFYPVYDSYIQMAKGLPHRLDALIAKLSDWLQLDGEESEEEESVEKESVKEDIQFVPSDVHDDAAKAAETRVRVMPALRWRFPQGRHPPRRSHHPPLSGRPGYP